MALLSDPEWSTSGGVATSVGVSRGVETLTDLDVKVAVHSAPWKCWRFI